MSPPQTHRRSWLPFVIGLLAVVMIGLVALNMRGRSATASTSGADPNNAQQVALGKQIYDQRCASCHGAQLEGQPNWQAELPTGGRPAPPHDASGHTWHHPDKALFEIIKFGGQASSPPGYKNNMPPFGALSDDDIWATLAYIKSTWPPDIRAAQEETNRQAQ